MRDLTFVIKAEQREKVTAWAQEHPCNARPDSFCALLTYQFTPTGIGDSVQVVCPCGAKLDLTEVETW